MGDDGISRRTPTGWRPADRSTGAQRAEVWKDKLPTRVAPAMAPWTRAEAGKTLRARSRSGFIASANMANVLALFGNMFAFKGSYQAEVRAASTSRFPARAATVVVSSRG